MTVVFADELDQVREGLEDAGYCVVRQVVSKDSLEEFNSRIVDAYSRSVKFDGGGSIMGHLNCFPGEMSRFVHEQLEERGILEFVRAACPDLSHGVRPTMNFNLPGSSAQHYHMDGVYTEEYMICNVAVVDTDLVNGAIDLLPGTHRRYYPYWRYAVERKYRLSTRIPMQQGDVLLRRSTLWHRGMPNRSQEPRPMFSLTVGERYDPQGDPFLVNGGRVEFYANWYSSGPMGTLRERVEKAAPITRSAVRFARSLVGDRGYSKY